MKNIVVIGSGNLGSRHLQGIVKYEKSCHIYAIDPNVDSLNLAKKRLSEDRVVKKINYYNNLDLLPKTVDLLIIATNSDVRYEVLEKVLSSRDVLHVVLEKVLFQDPLSYDKAVGLIEKYSVNCWVNHPRRMFEFYQCLRNSLVNSSSVSFSVFGGNWGMGCNSLHYLDLFAFLVDGHDIFFKDFEIVNLFESKRKGYFEFNGKIGGSIGRHSFSLNSYDDKRPIFIIISSDEVTATIDEVNGFVRLANKANDWKWETINDPIISFQSDVSKKLVESILDENACMLPTYKEAFSLHVPFISLIINGLNKFVGGEKFQICPIT